MLLHCQIYISHITPMQSCPEIYLLTEFWQYVHASWFSHSY